MRDRAPSSQRPAIIPRLLLALALLAPLASDAGAIDRVRSLAKAALLVEDDGRTTISHNPDQALIPASTMKVLTALHALDRWGPKHRFATEVYIDPSKILWFKGLGDPYLVSEEIDHMVGALKTKGVSQVSGIGIDASLFSPDLRIPGRSSTSNPYDAPVTALAVNFNTINVHVADGKVYTAEPQTPLTSLARRLARGLGAGRHRINLKNQANSLRYAGELFAAKLETVGIRVADAAPISGRVPAGSRLLLRHLNTRTLSQVIANMLEYSTNFVANDLFMLLGERERERDRGQMTMAQARRAATDWAAKRFGWRSFNIEDGAGLSRGNHLSARQLTQTLDAFAPHRGLMPRQDGNSGVRAKTGSLRGVSCYAGYVRRGGHWSTFVLLINQPVDYNLRLRVASELARK